MNSLSLLQSEITAPGVAELVGLRFSYYQRWHGYDVGKELPVTVIDQGIGWGRIIERGVDRVVVNFDIYQVPLPRLPVLLIVAVPRPQMIKRVVLAATLLGVAELRFVRSERVDKSYLNSRELRPERFGEEVMRGLEQAIDCCGPQITVESSLGHLGLGASASCGRKFLAHGGAARRFELKSLQLTGQTALAIGPEAGWTPSEVTLFEEAGFEALALGPRVLRVDVAVTALLGGLAFLNDSW